MLEVPSFVRRWATAMPRVLAWIGLSAAATLALVHVGLLLYIFAQRLTYPFDLEWMEGGMLCHALRVMQGQPIYAEPSADFISYLYTPLYPWVLATLGRLFGLSYALARAVSVVSFGAFCAIAVAVVWRHAGHKLAAVSWGIVAVGLIASSFPHVTGWYDLVRNDSLNLALTAAGLYVLVYYHRSTRMVLLAGVLMGAAFLTKQTASLFIVFSGLALLWLDWRRLPLYVTTVGVVAGGTSLWLNHATHGWYWRYVYQMHQRHEFYPKRLWPQTEERLFELFPAVALALALWVIVAVVRKLRRMRTPRARQAATFYWWCVALVGVVAAAVGFSTQWSGENAMIPALCFGSLAAAVAGADLTAHIDRRALVGRWAYGLLTLLAAGALAYQLQQQLYRPRPYLPPAGSRAAGEALLAQLARIPGPVLIPYHPFYPHLIGKPINYHQMGTNDVTRAGYPFPPSIRQRIMARYYGAIVLDSEPHARYGFAIGPYRVARHLPPNLSPQLDSRTSASRAEARRWPPKVIPGRWACLSQVT